MGENKFPKQIKDILEYLDFIYDDRYGNYDGKVLINGDTEVLFRFNIVRDSEVTYNIACYSMRDNIINLFEVSDQVSQGTFIVLLQEFGIIHNRYTIDTFMKP